MKMQLKTRKIFQILVLGVCTLSFAPPLPAFVLINGITEARLDVSPDQPIVTFFWNGSAPSIKKKEEFAGGAYAALDDQDFFLALLFNAMGLWNSVRGSYIQLEVEMNQSIQLDRDDEVHAIVVQSDSSVTTAAAALPFVEGERIKDCDIKINNRRVDAKMLAYTIAHELGHCLGLGHSHSSYHALMGYSRSKYDLSLGVDDKAGLIYLYPDPVYAGDGPKEVISCGSVANKRIPTNINDQIYLFFLIFPALIIVWRR